MLMRLCIDRDGSWREALLYTTDVRAFVARGGLYFGFCLGAFLAGPHNGSDLLPAGERVKREIERLNSQVDSIEDAVIQFDWTVSTGQKQGTKQNNRWLYFQDGAAFVLSDKSPTTVPARYSQNGDVASTLNSFGRDWVANVGPHPEADQTWCRFQIHRFHQLYSTLTQVTPDDLAEIPNPEGIRLVLI
jgi:glutamine amidotransferase-like uncharacterized protein